MNKTLKSIIISAVMLAASTSLFAASKKSIVCTTFPEYDWVMNILGEKAGGFDVTLLQNNGTDLHSYQPSVKDIAKISKADLFVYVGGESDEWVEKVVSQSVNENQVVVNMMEVLGDKVREEEIVEGMQTEEEEEHEHHHHDGEGHHHEHDEAAMQIYNGYFEDDMVKDRALTDWEGEWQSVYPMLLDGSLDGVMQEKAEIGPMTFEENKAYYDYGYKTDVEKIVIKGKKMSFYVNGKASTATYEYKGLQIYNYAKGNRGVRFFFEAKNAKGNAPKYVQFSDHGIAPNKAMHFHIYFGNEGFYKLSEEMEHWPTYYPTSFDVDDVCDDMLEHMGIHHHHDEAEEEEVEYDEHVWLSLNNAIDLTEALCAEIAKIDEANAAVYAKNAAAYTKQLSALDAEYKAAVKAAKKSTVLFGDRFPFRYLTDDYDLKYYAAFVGCSAETEASFETIIFLANKVDELGLNAVLTIEKSDKKIARTVVDSTKNKNQQILEMDSLQSITTKEIKEGRNYLSAMKKNLEVLKKALN